ncbi:hypothetical protein [Alkalihalobacillus sp. LMS39]|uniref:hypothetical protein n=1 Tax=Alkalihalobacillus sp. LMS39 TaxID=2924032 RepID=UPI001FB1BDAD|nr:hypothetical protein [Alkalihalobacillus sp. LMS39]UOE94743.1 hypothetical protein MM271_03600 [Alkalihalobacillus sp. LMS39]
MSCIGYTIYLNEKLEFVNQLNDPNQNVNTEAVTKLVENYNGYMFLYNLWFNSFGVDVVLIIVLISWIGISFTPRLNVERESRFGDLVMTRSTYKSRFNDILIAQSLYITSVLFIFVTLTFILAMVFGGIPTTPFEIADQHFGLLSILLVNFLQWIWLSLIVITFNAFCAVCNIWIKRKYILQILPFTLFVILPVLAGTIIGNTFPITAPFFMHFSIEGLIGALGFIYNPYITLSNFFKLSVMVLTAFVLFLLIYPIHIKKWSEDYL